MVSDQRKLTLRRPGTCRSCGVGLPAGVTAWYRRSDRSVACHACVSRGEAVNPGIAGASAKAEYEKRRRRREQRTRAAHPRVGGLVSALRDAPRTEMAWRIGYEGEQQLAAELDKRLAGTPAILLHDRRLPGTRANVDHLAIGPAGVFVIDAKRYSGRIEKRVHGGLVTPRQERLYVSGRDRTTLIESILRQREAVARALQGAPGRSISVQPLLCFVDGRFPLLRLPTVNGVRVVPPRVAAQLIAGNGPLEASRIAAVAAYLSARLPTYVPAG